MGTCRDRHLLHPILDRGRFGNGTSEITFPRLIGYRFDLPHEELSARFAENSHLALTTKDVPRKTEDAPAEETIRAVLTEPSGRQAARTTAAMV